MKLTAALACAALAIFAAGCAKTLDTGDVESEINSKLKATNASCPDDVEAKKGETFTCTATDSSGKEVTIQIDQLDDSGNIELRQLPPGVSTTPDPGAGDTSTTSTTSTSTGG